MAKPSPEKARAPTSKNPFEWFWYYLTKDEGPIGWIVNIVVAFVVIKYLLLPAAGWLLGTSFPLVAVVSGSMEHQGAFDQWWGMNCELPEGEISQSELYKAYGIDRRRFEEFDFTGGMNTGDLILLKGAKEVYIGDVVVFNAGTKYDPIIHRVVQIKDLDGQKTYKTKGDHNCGSSPFESATPRGQIVGKAWIRIPLLGFVKLYFEKLLSWIGLGAAVRLFR